jgi:hypothetical protein
MEKPKYLFLIYILMNCLSFSYSSAQGKGFFNYDWKSAIDTTWGPGMPTDYKLAVFDSTWTVIDQKFACFNNLVINWDSLKTVYRSEIQSGVSAGRFAAILNHMGAKLKEGHTSFIDEMVNNDYNPKPKKPLIYPALWGYDQHFGAGLSILPDSSLLVYAAENNHPLGLKPGDVVLGYEGMPWKKLYKTLLSMEFPLGALSGIGGNDDNITENWLKGVGRNWHLFDTIDIIKFNSVDTIHLPTNLMENAIFTMHHTDQLPVPGVKFHSMFQGDTTGQDYTLSWGIVENTNIGYVYIWSWFEDNIPTRFYNAIDSLINVHHVDGLILDIRANRGGNVNYSDRGLDLLFATTPSTLGLAHRNNPYDHYSLSNSGVFAPVFNPNTFFDKPIAVLTGSFAISAADFICYRLREHPRARFFGSQTSSSFASSTSFQMNNYMITYAAANGYSELNPTQYLTHSIIRVDEKVTFTPEDVSQGIDTIVKEALAYIKSQIISVKDETNPPTKYSLTQNYPNPFNPTTTINYSLSKSGNVKITVYNAIGSKVTTIVNEYKPAGNYSVQFNGSNLASGIYLYRLESGNFSDTKKLILLK